MTTVLGRRGAICSIHARTWLTAAMNSGGCRAVTQGSTHTSQVSAGGSNMAVAHPFASAWEKPPAASLVPIIHTWRSASPASVIALASSRGVVQPTGRQAVIAHPLPACTYTPGNASVPPDVAHCTSMLSPSTTVLAGAWTGGGSVGRRRAGSQAAVTAIRVVAAMPVTRRLTALAPGVERGSSRRDQALDLSVGCGHADDPRCHRRSRRPCACRETAMPRFHHGLT